MNGTKVFIAEEKGLEFYNRKALINLEMAFVYLDDEENELDFEFPDYVSAYFRVYESSKRVSLLKNFTSQITHSGNLLYYNCSVIDMTFEDYGKYYFELGYNMNGYEIPLRFGELCII